jgi:hypothetical protein
MSIDKQTASEQAKKILKGLKLSYSKLLEAKKLNNSYLVVSRQGKILKIKP